MNRGQRHIRNTMLAMLGVTVLLPAASRLHASVVKPDTPPWLRSLVSLGQTVAVSGNDMAQMQVVRLEDAGQLRFSQIGVEGNFAVEVISAPLHKVSLTGADGQASSVAVNGQKDGLLLLKGDAGSKGAVLRIEAPALTSINARNLPQLTIRGLQAQRLSIGTTNVGRVRLEENAIKLWILNSGTPVVVEADKATIAAGLDIQASGVISLHGDGGQRVNFRGSGGQFSLSGPNAEISIRAGK